MLRRCEPRPANDGNENVGERRICVTNEQAIEWAAAQGLSIGMQRCCDDGRVYEIKTVYWYESSKPECSAIHLHVIEPNKEVRIYTIDDFNPSRVYWECGYVDVMPTT